MKIAVTGPRGRLGSELVRRGCIPIGANVTDFMELGAAVRSVKPDIVIHAAAYTQVDMAENTPLVAGSINTGGTFGLGQVFKGKIIYISTDYVFNGENGPYDELDPPDPIGIYGWSKLGGEIALINRGNPADLIVRTTVLFDGRTQNFVTSVYEKLKAQSPLTLPFAMIGSPTYIPALATALLEAAEKDLAGYLHIAGGRLMSRYQLGLYIAAAMGITQPELSALISPAPAENPARHRPLKAGLIINKAAGLGLTISDPLDGIKEVVHELENLEAGRPDND